MTVSIYGVASESNVNITNNTSDVTVNLYASWTAGTYAHDSPAGYIIIDGTTYNFNANFNVGNTSSGSSWLTAATKTVSHNSDGSKSISWDAEFDGNGSYNVYTSGSLGLTTIPRQSVIGSVSAFNFEDAFSVPLTKYSGSFTDNLEIKIGSTVIKTISGYTSGAEITLTDSELLSVYAALGTNISATVTFTLSTYSGGTYIGSSATTATVLAAGTFYDNVSGVWKRAVPHANVSGVWKKAIAYINVSGTWKRGK